MRNYLILFKIIMIINSCASVYTLDEINTTLKSAKSIEIEKDDLGNNSKKIDPKDQFIIDSIANKLIENKEVILPIKYKNIIENIDRNSIIDTIILTNIFTKSPTGGVPLNYQFDVKKNDIIIYEFNNTNISKIEKINIIEGDATRLLLGNFKGNSEESGSFRVLADNKLMLNISNDKFLKNLGLFRSKLKVSMKKVSSSLKIKTEIINDTVFKKNKVIEEVTDTIYNIYNNKKYNLKSTLYLSNKNRITLPIHIKNKNNLIGWGYWIGLKSSDTIDPKSYIDFSKQEILKSSYNKSELESINEDISLTINNQSLDLRSLNYGKNFAFYISDNNILNDNNKGIIYVKNNSNLYDYSIQFVLISINLRKSKIEIEKNTPVISKYFKLSLITDE